MSLPISRAAPLAAPVAASPASTDVRVITFNTASGNSRYDQAGEAFLSLPFYQDVIQGRPNAPILAGQEIHGDQLAALKKAAEGGNFTVIDAGRPPGYREQHNVILVPKRFEVLSHESRYFKASALKGVASAVSGWFGERRLPSKNELSQVVEPRMWSEVRLKDRETGKVFTVFNTHVSWQNDIRLAQMKDLMARVREAQKDGPVVLAGDLNTHTAESSPTHATDAKIRDLFEAAELRDTDANPGRIGKKPNIDWILTDDFQTVSSRQYVGGDLQMPGGETAEKISDHYAEEAVLRWK